VENQEQLKFLNGIEIYPDGVSICNLPYQDRETPITLKNPNP
jgi:hypothetical protein